jgi:hypothetical protein
MSTYPHEQVSLAEQAWIDFYSQTSPLTNVGCGGQGGSPRLVKIEWTPEIDSLLGKISDTELAERLGCHRKNVSYRRTNFGIPSCPQKNFVIPPMGGWNKLELLPEHEAQLGQIPDYKLAELAGVDKSVVQRCRRDRNIQSYAERTGNNGQIRKGEPHRRWSRG